MTFPHFSKNGKILPANQAVIPLSNIEYSYGFGVYETIRVTSKIPYFLQEHLERLISSAEIIRLTHPFNIPAITKWIKELISQTPEPTFNLKILLIGASQQENAEIFLMPSSPLFPKRKWVKEGVKIISVEYERYYPHAKTLNMLGSFLAYKKAKENNCYDALLINKKREILEGTRTNVYFLKNDILYSPPGKDILLGVMRMVLLKLLEKAKIEIKEESIPYDTIPTYEGAFLTSTSSKILPIRQIDNYKFGKIPPITAQLIKLLDTFLDRSKGELKLIE